MDSKQSIFTVSELPVTGSGSVRGASSQVRTALGVFFKTLIPALIFCVLSGFAAGKGIVVDHTSLSLFEKIPERYLEAARNLNVLFMDRSVGVNTHDALNCFTAKSYRASPVSCRRDFREVNGSWRVSLQRDAPGNLREYISFSPDSKRYDRSNWTFYLFYGAWKKMAVSFTEGLNRRAIPVKAYPTKQDVLLDPLNFDVLSFQFGYLNVDEGSDIGEFFSRSPGEFDDVYDLEREVADALTRANPPRVFVYWTTNLARGIGSEISAEFNGKMRQWCLENDKILFDFADIQSHDMFGQPCYDNRDGVPYSTPSGNKSENHPDDGLEIPAICQENTFETDGGHLATAQGTVSVAKGLWILVARVAGWEPGDS